MTMSQAAVIYDSICMLDCCTITTANAGSDVGMGGRHPVAGMSVSVLYRLHLGPDS